MLQQLQALIDLWSWANAAHNAVVQVNGNCLNVQVNILFALGVTSYAVLNICWHWKGVSIIGANQNSMLRSWIIDCQCSSISFQGYVTWIQGCCGVFFSKHFTADLERRGLFRTSTSTQAGSQKPSAKPMNYVCSGRAFWNVWHKFNFSQQNRSRQVAIHPLPYHGFGYTILVVIAYNHLAATKIYYVTTDKSFSQSKSIEVKILFGFKSFQWFWGFALRLPPVLCPSQ